MHKLVRIGGGAGAVVQLVDRDQIAGFAVDHDFRNAASGGCDDRQTAGHGLKVHDAQRLVDARADEGITAVFQSIQLRLRQHFFNPDDVAAFLIQLGERDLDLFGDFRGVRSTGAQHHLNVLGNQVQCLEQVWQALLAGDTAHEQQGGLRTVDVVTLEHLPTRIVWCRGSEVGHGDAVVHHNHLVRIEVRVSSQNILAHATGNGDHTIGVLVSILLSPGAQIVAAAELLTLPRAERLQRVRGNNQWSAVQHLGHVARQAGIPGVRVDDVGVHIIGDLQINAEGLQCGVGISQLRRRVIADDLQAALSIGSIRDSRNVRLGALAIKRTNGYVDALGKHLGQFLGVYTGPTIDMRRVFAG